MPLEPGTQLGIYEVLSLLGQGGMGEVYRARDGRLKRTVALKILPASFADDPHRVARFQREAELLASLITRTLPATTSTAFHVLLRRCLARDPNQRPPSTETSGRPGELNVFVRPFPDVTRRVSQITTAGGTFPRGRQAAESCST